MSLVGKELEVSFVPVGTETAEDTEDEIHPPLSPATGVEALFLHGLLTSNISANALATELRKKCRTRSNSRSNSTVGTDDFVSTCDNMDDLVKFEEPITKEARALYQQPIYEFEEEPKMSNTKPTADEVNVDAVAHIYEGIKNVWGWGKKQIIISTFLGITEAVAEKVVGVVGTDLEEIDGNVKPKLAEIDNSILNPAVRGILGVILNAAGKSQDIFKPIVVAILKPVGLIRGSRAVSPERTTSSSTTVSLGSGNWTPQ